MALESIMVYVDSDPDSEDRICAAADLASRFQSFLIGVAGWPLRHGELTPPAPAAGDPERQKRIEKTFAQLEEKFRQAAKDVPRGLEWRAFPHFPREVLPAEARSADLLVIGRDALAHDPYRTYDPGMIIIAAGRPVLVLPRGVRQITASRALVAWKDAREARRAICDALPILKTAQQVDIAVANPALQPTRPIDEQIADLTRYFAGHGISVTQQIESVAGEDEAHLLLRLAEKRQADLIVAGAYGRTRLSEWLFGGVTRHLLAACPIPCLFSH